MNASQFECFERDTFRSSEIKRPARRDREGDRWIRTVLYISERDWHLCADANYFYHIPFICLSLAVMEPRSASKAVNVPVALIVG